MMKMPFQSFFSLKAALLVVVAALIAAPRIAFAIEAETSNRTDWDSSSILDGTNETSIQEEEEEYGNTGVITTITQITGALSMVGSFWIMADVVLGGRQNNWNMSPYHRIMFGLSFYDMCSSFFYFVIPWIRNGGDEDEGGAAAACAASGFFVWLASLCIPLYNAALAYYFSLSVRHGWVEDRIYKQFERRVHPIIAVFGLAFVVPAIPYDLWNRDYLVCYPLDQEEHPEATSIYFLFYAIAILFSAMFVTWLMLMVYCHVSKVLIRSRHISSQSSKNDNQATATASQDDPTPMRITRSSLSLEDWLPKVRAMALLYTIPFYITWLVPLCWNTLLVLVDTGAIAHVPSARTVYIMKVYLAAALPLQGFLNWIIYIDLFSVTGTFLRGLSSKSRRSGLPDATRNNPEHQEQHAVVPPEMPEPSADKEGAASNHESSNHAFASSVDEGGTPAIENVQSDDTSDSTLDVSDRLTPRRPTVGVDGQDNVPAVSLNNRDSGEDGLVSSIGEGSKSMEAMEAGTILSASRGESHGTDGVVARGGSNANTSNTRQEGETGSELPHGTRPSQPTATEVQEALENALDLVRESAVELESIVSEGGDEASVDSQCLRVIGIITEALELTRSFFESESEDGTASHQSPSQPAPLPVVTPPTTQSSSNPRGGNMSSVVNNFISNAVTGLSNANGATSCQAPPPFFTSQAALFPTLNPSTPFSPPRTPGGDPDHVLQILDEALDILNSEAESISNGSRGSDMRSIRSGSAQLEAMLEGTLDAFNNFLPPPQRSSSHRLQQQQEDDAPQTTRPDSRVPSVLENVRRVEVSTLSSTIVDSSTIVEEDQNQEEEEENETPNAGQR